MNNNKVDTIIAAAQRLIDRGDYDDMREALCAAAEEVLTQADCEAWHRTETTPTTDAIVEAFARFDIAPNIWGSPEGPEPVSVSWA